MINARRINISFLINQALLACGIVAGFGRELVLASFFGLGETLDLFRNASLLPVTASETLNAAFVFAIIPHLVKAEDQSDENARKHISASLYISLFLVLVIFVIGFFFASTISIILFPGNSSEALARASRLAWPMFLFTGVTFGLRGMFFQSGKTWLGAATPVVRSGGFIFWLILFKLLQDGEGTSLPWAIAALVLSGAGVFFIHIVTLDQDIARRWWRGVRYPAFDYKIYRSVFGALVLSLAYYGLTASTRVIDQGYTSLLPAGSVSAVEFSYSLTMAFGVLFATAFNLTQAVNISRGIRDKSHAAVVSARAGYSIALMSGIICLFFSFFSNEILNLLLHYGKMSKDNVTLVASLFSVQSIGVPFLVAGLIGAQFMIALHRFDVLIISALIKVFVKYVFLYDVFINMGIYSTVYSFVASEIVSSAILIAFTELLIVRRFTGNAR